MRVRGFCRDSIFIALLFSLQSCGSGNTPKETEPFTRQGADYQVLNGSLDNIPSVSKDGSKIVFITTRDGDERVYKADIKNDTNAKIEATLLMKTGVLSGSTRLLENQAWISPSGVSVFFTVKELSTSTNQYSLYQVDYNAGTIISKIDSTTGFFSNLVFSEDSLVLAYTKTEGDESKTFVRKVSPSSDESSKSITGTSLFFQSSTSPYKLIIAQVSTQTKNTGLFNVDVNSSIFAQASSLSASSWGLSDAKISLDFSDVGRSSSNAYFLNQDMSSKQYVAINGTAISDPKTAVTDENYKNFNLLENNILTVNLSTETKTDRTSISQNARGYKILSLSLSTSADMGVALFSERHQCGSKNSILTGKFMGLLTLGASTELTPVLPTSKFSISNNLCSSDASVTLDYNVQDAVISGASTSSSYRIFYTSSLENQLRLYVLDSPNTIRQVK